ncbi:MAG: hypothetical protein HY744_12030 [Deltaproteobacteria bacterium]|nr:hypothetical protein [Deltaproteobacteria bacterium]
MAFGKALKSLFWQSSQGPASGADEAPAAGGEVADEELMALLGQSPHAVPAGAFEPVDPQSVQLGVATDGAVSIDFQAQYDAAGIPDTDEVEQLENFLNNLDGSLPHASKIAAAEAFLKAIGKDRPAVLTDAERKVKRVHGIVRSKEQETQQALAQEQAAIDELQARIEQHRQLMEQYNRQLEGVRQACLREESRLQAARVFFGEVRPPGAGR